MDSGSGNVNLVICQNPVDKGITTMLIRSNPVETFILGAQKILLLIIVIDGAPQCLFSECTDAMFSTKGKFIKYSDLHVRVHTGN